MNEKLILPGKRLSIVPYLSTILNLAEELTKELAERLKKEGRYTGLAKSYVHSMWDTFSLVNQVITDEEEEEYNRVLFLFRKILTQEYNSLRGKGLSEGDSVIILLKKTYEIILEKAPEGWEYLRRVKTLLKLVDKFFDNIRNRKKTARLFNYSDFLKGCIEGGYLGRRTISGLSLSTGAKGLKIIEVLEDPGDRLGREESSVTVGEISW